MKDLAIYLQNKPGALAVMGEVLGNAGVSLEGGGVFVYNDKGIAHFLVGDAEKGKKVLETNGFSTYSIHIKIYLMLSPPRKKQFLPRRMASQ